MADTPTLVRFIIGYTPDGISEDGMPIYKEVVKIVLSRPPYLEVTEVATEDHFEEHRDAYRLFQKEQAGLKKTGEDGYPLVMWPAINPADLQSCLVRDIHTVEQLAKHASRGPTSLPPSVAEAAKRAKRMIELQKETGRYEAKISDLEGQIGALREQNNEQRARIDAQEILITQLSARPAA
jgi:hypothetical protein